MTFGNSETCHLLCQWLRVSTNLALSCSRIWRFPKTWCFPLSAWQPRLPCSPLAPRKTLSHRWHLAVFRNTALKKACKPKDMLAGNWNTRAVVKWSFFQMKESLSLPSQEDTMTGYRSIQRKQNASTHHYKRKRGSIQECSRCVLPTFQSQEFTLSTANRIFLKKDFKPKKRYILYFIIQLYQILCKGFWMTWRKTFNPQQKY